MKKWLLSPLAAVFGTALVLTACGGLTEDVTVDESGDIAAAAQANSSSSNGSGSSGGGSSPSGGTGGESGTTYKVIFYDTDNTTALKTIEVAEGAVIPTDAAPNKEVDGVKQAASWYSDKEHTKEWSWKTTLLKKRDLYADNWIRAYTVTFAANGASGTTDAITQTIANGAITLPESGFTHESLAFNGWCAKASGNGRLYKAGASFSPEADTTLYAVWVSAEDVTEEETIEYATVSFYDTDCTTLLKRVEVPVGTVIPYEDCPTVDGKIAEWNAISNFGKENVALGSTYQFTEKLSKNGRQIAAKEWSAPAADITFEANSEKGGSGSAVTLQRQAAGSYGGITLPYQPDDFTNSDANKVFLGWSTTAGGTTTLESGANYKISTDTAQTLYAVWATPYTVTFDANAADATGSMTALKGSDTYTLPANAFVRSGYVFAGWTTAADGTGTAYANEATVTITSNTRLYAQWTRVCGISFDANSANAGDGATISGAVAALSVSSIINGEKLALPTATFTHSNNSYAFSHWNTKPDGTGIGYLPSTEDTASYVYITSSLFTKDDNGNYANASFDDSENLVLYAQWYESKSLNDAITAIYSATSDSLYYKITDSSATLSSTTVTVGNTADITLAKALQNTKAKIFLDFSGCTLTLSSKEFEGNAKVTDAGLVGLVLNSPAVIPSWTFKNSLALTSVLFGSGVTNIKGVAFENCTGLKYVTVDTAKTWKNSSGTQDVTDLATNGSNLAADGSWYGTKDNGGIWKQ